MQTTEDPHTDPATSPGLIEHICGRIAATPVTASPFPHIVVDDVLPDDVFAALLADLPTTDDLTPMSKLGWRSVAAYERHSTVLVQELEGRSDPQLWQDLDGALASTVVEDALRRSFAPWVDDETSTRPVTRQVRVDCGRPGAVLQPHTDSPIVLMKSLIHLSPQTDHPSSDTILMAPKDPEGRRAALGDEGDFSIESYAHESSDDHEEVARVRFRPNRMWSFLRSASSVHGLGPLDPVTAPRFIIAVHYKFVV